MLVWLTENMGTIIICGVLAAVVSAIIISMIKSKKKGSTACGCKCSSCPMSGGCNSSD